MNTGNTTGNTADITANIDPTELLTTILAKAQSMATVPDAEYSLELQELKKRVVEIFMISPATQIIGITIGSFSIEQINNAIKQNVLSLKIEEMDFVTAKVTLFESIPFDLSNLDNELNIRTQKELYTCVKRWIQLVKEGQNTR